MMNTCMRYQDWTYCCSWSKENQWNKCTAKWHIPPVIKSAFVHLGWGSAQQLQRVTNYSFSHFGHVDQADSLNQWILDPQNVHTRATCGTLVLLQLLQVKQCRKKPRSKRIPCPWLRTTQLSAHPKSLCLQKPFGVCEMLHLSACWW